MIDYVQPDFYRFNSDSIELAKFVYEQNNNKKLKSVADYFCGCGVIGIELIQLGLNCEEITFLEKNKKFIPFINKNTDLFIRRETLKPKIIINNTSIENSLNNKFDLIVANPPYFYPLRSRLSENEDRNAARFFHHITFFEIVMHVNNHLTEGGRGYILYRADHILSEKKKIEELSISNQFKFNDAFFGDVGLLIIF